MRNQSLLPRPFIAIAAIAMLLIAAPGCSDDVDPGGENGASVDVGGDEQSDAGGDLADAADDEHDADRIDDTGEPDDVFDPPDVTQGVDTSTPPQDSGQPEDPDVEEEADVEEEELAELAVDELRPRRGPVTGGTPFVIDGQGFTDQTVVLFGAQEVAVDFIDEMLTGITPPGEATGPVTVRVIDDETGDETLVDGFTYIDPLQIDHIQPSILHVDGGTEVTLEGSGFSEDTRVTVGDRSSPQHTVINSTMMRFIAPPNPAGTADVRVTDEDSAYVKSDGITYVAPVELHAVTPPYGSTAGGDEVTVEGSGFDDNLVVRFDEITGTVEQVNSDGTEATVITPAGSAGVVNVRVTTDDDGARLDDGFAYIGDGSGDLHVDALVPNQGKTTGGERVYLTGQFGDLSDPNVSFGGESATVVNVDAAVIAVDTPSVSTAGAVDVVVEDNGEMATADNGFTFVTPLTISEVSPAQGSVDGGTDVTVSGSGFEQAMQLQLAGLSVDFDIIDDETIELTTPAAGPGPADLRIVTDDDRFARLDDAFYFLDALELWSFSPIRGSVAGNTYVEVRGTGFTEDTEIFFNDLAAQEIELLNPYTLAVRTPSHGSDVVPVSAEDGSDQVEAPESFTYFNPGAQTGGAWGNPIDGAVNVTVFSIAFEPIENAFVMLSTSAQTPYTGLTNAGGQVTLSGPDILGQQTITATAPDHSSATVQYVDAENITVFLQPEDDGDPPMPPPPPTATFTGEITGLDKLDQPGPNEILMAYVETTRPSIYDDLPDPGGQNMVTEDGPYTIQTRVGELALVVIGGLFNTSTEEFRPTRMGVARYLTAADGGHYEVDIPLDIPLSSEIDLKFDGAPMQEAPGGPDTNTATLYMDLSIDGIYGPMQEYTTQSEIAKIDALAALEGDLDDANYRILAQTTFNDALPLSQAFVHDIVELNQTHATPPMVSTLDFITPNQGGMVEDGLVQWNLHGIHQPDLYYIFLESMMGQTIWEIFLPGDAMGFQFPDFPAFDPGDFDEETGVPFPYPGGLYSLVAIGFGKDGLSAEDFSYDDLNPATARGVSVSSLIVSF